MEVGKILKCCIYWHELGSSHLVFQPYNRVNYDWTNSFQQHFPEALGQGCHRHWRCHGVWEGSRELARC